MRGPVRRTYPDRVRSDATLWPASVRGRGCEMRRWEKVASDAAEEVIAEGRKEIDAMVQPRA